MRMVLKIVLAVIGYLAGLVVVAIGAESSGRESMPALGNLLGIALGVAGWVLAGKLSKK
jgi:hypothetical protein